MAELGIYPSRARVSVFAPKRGAVTPGAHYGLFMSYITFSRGGTGDCGRPPPSGPGHAASSALRALPWPWPPGRFSRDGRSAEIREYVVFGRRP